MNDKSPRQNPDPGHNVANFGKKWSQRNEIQTARKIDQRVTIASTNEAVIQLI